jgi:hypothetical protein
MPITSLFTPVLQPDQIGDIIDASPTLRTTWLSVRAAHEKAIRYYSGDIFKDVIETEVDENGAPLLYPIGVNLVKMIVLSMTDSAFGEWDDQRSVILFRPRSETPPAIERDAVDYATQVMEDSNAGSMFWEIEFDRNLCGAGVLRVNFDFTRPSKIRWSRVPIDSFYPVFDPEDPDKLLECWYVTQILPEQARQMYGFDALGDMPVTRTEHWTKSVYETMIDGQRVDAYSGVNPWGVIPFVYIPRMRTIDWWGEGLAEDIYAPQDEINMRLADAGEALNVHAHPVLTGTNLPRDFNAKNFPLSANAMWDLGRTRAGGDKPEVGLLESENPVAPVTFEYIKFLYDFTRTSASAPPIAFGEDNGGGQRSGVTLEIRLWPLLKAMRRSRGYLTAGLLQALQITGMILKQKNFRDVPAGVAEALIGRRVVPSYNPILPRDQSAIVDEVVKLMSTDPPSISLESAQIALGRGTQEVTKIMNMIAEISEWPAVKAALASLSKPKSDGPNEGLDEKDKPDKSDEDAVKEGQD